MSYTIVSLKKYFIQALKLVEKLRVEVQVNNIS